MFVSCRIASYSCLYNGVDDCRSGAIAGGRIRMHALACNQVISYSAAKMALSMVPLLQVNSYFPVWLRSVREWNSLVHDSEGYDD